MAAAMRRAALRNGIHVQRLHALLKRRVVNRQRAFQKRVARERHQAQPVRRRPFASTPARRAWRAPAGSARCPCASMDFEVSTATTMSSPRCSTSSKSNPCCGRASATIKSATARITSANRIFRRAGEMPTVSDESNRASMNCASNFCRARSRHQKNSASAGGTTSSSQSKLWMFEI